MTSGVPAVHGYDRGAVELYLDQCAAECARLRAEIATARERIARAHTVLAAQRVMQEMLHETCVELAAAQRQSDLIAARLAADAAPARIRWSSPTPALPAPELPAPALPAPELPTPELVAP